MLILTFVSCPSGISIYKIEFFGLCCLQVYNQKIQFAPIGLIDMYNAGGAIEAVDIFNFGITIKGRGAGGFGAYSNLKPRFCHVNSKEEEFEFRDEDYFLIITIPSGTTSWDLTVQY